jgi:hypothetical protein
VVHTCWLFLFQAIFWHLKSRTWAVTSSLTTVLGPHPVLVCITAQRSPEHRRWDSCLNQPSFRLSDPQIFLGLIYYRLF